MRNCVVDGREIKDREQLHDVLEKELDFPDWYGRNLDALYDCLTDMQEETEIRLFHRADLKAYLGSYAKSLEKVLCAAAANNLKIHYTVEE